MFLVKTFFAAIVLGFMPKMVIAEFVKLREDKINDCSHQLSSIENIPYQCKIITDQSNSLEVWQNRLSFEFGQISRSQFDRLKNIYSGGRKSKSALVYNPQKSYQLNDFLPPIIQALNNHRFIPEVENKQQKQLYMNCWGLVYEILRAATEERSQPVIFMGQGSLMLNQLRQNSYDLITINEPEDKIAKSLIQPGDILLIMHKSSSGYEYLDHVAIAIDEGIYFEKAGTGADVPIRIIDETTLRQIWQPGVFYYEVRRLKEDAVLPHPQDIFSLHAPTIQQEFELPNISPDISKITSIMWEESEKDLASSSLFHIVNPLLISVDNMGKAKLSPRLYQPLFSK